MNITKNSVMKDEIFDNIRVAVVGEREGIHLSDLIYCTRKAYFRKKGLSPKPTNDQCILWLTGFAFQAFMFPLDKEIPVIYEGVVCTPDIPRGIEVKSTRQSMRKFIPEGMHHWLMQIMGYMKALGKTKYDLAVMFVCGAYAPPFPDLDCWTIEATQEDIDDNWNEVMVRRTRLVHALETHTPPDPDCADWEWEYCECIDNCTETQCYRKKQLKGGKK
jgi:hypothetical protein